MIYLNSKLKLGRGTTRTCYLHPEQEELCIKIMHHHSKLKINDLEYKFYKKLEQKQISHKHLPKCYGFVETNLGKGLVYERVKSDYAEFAENLDEVVKQKLLPKNKVISLLKDLENYCLNNIICMCDRGLRNIIISKGKLYYIDGIITNKKGKSFLYTGLTFYSRRKTRKTIRTMLNLVEQAYATNSVNESGINLTMKLMPPYN